MVTNSRKTTKVAAAANTPGSLVLQWLTYAFWGWTALALIWLTAQSVSFFIDSEATRANQNESVAYSLAAVIVLFIISFICDSIYSKREPIQKHGASMVIMIIHAVIFALFAIGSLITAVFAVVNLMIGSGNDSSEGPRTVLITGLVMTVVYAATLLRTLRPFKLESVTLIYGFFMAAVSIVVTVLGIMGPALYASQTRDDRLIERALPQLSENIRSYTEKNDALPTSLATLNGSLTDDAKQLVDRKLVEYIPGKEQPMTGPLAGHESLDSSRIMPPASTKEAFSYQLCVIYKAKKGTNANEPTPALYKVNDVSPDTYSHPAGRVCYDLITAYARYY